MFGYIITMLAACFWVFRVIVSLMYTAEVSFITVPMNFTVEIILLFITFACIVLIAKRKMIGAVIYLISHCSYYGIYAYKSLAAILSGQEVDMIALFISLIAILIPVLAIMSIGLNTGKKSSLKNRKTDWFYGTTDYERNFDERADKNQYKF